jgi:retron-type reverse transcriptase
MLEAGYVEDWTFHATHSGTPQGGVVSPILANIYLHELDEFLAATQVRFNRGKRRAENPQYQRLTIGIYKRRLRIDRLLSENRTAEAEAVKAKIRKLEAERSLCRRRTDLIPTSNGCAFVVMPMISLSA